MAKRISVINFKGGVGKTTLSFHLATGLARYHGSRVLLVDVDHQSSLSVACLGSDGWETAVAAGQSIDTIFKVFSHPVALPGRGIIEYRAIRKAYGSIYDKLDLVPASLSLDDTEIELTASHQGNAIQSEWNKRTLLCRWLEEAGVDEEYDYIIFDCPPATKIVSQNAIAASHGYIVPVVPEAVMERGAPHLQSMIRSGIDLRLQALAALGDKRSHFVPTTDLVGMVVTRLRPAGNAHSGYTNDHTEHLESLKRRWQADLVEPYIEDGTGVSQALASSLPVYDLTHRSVIGNRGFRRVFEELTAELKKRIDAL